ncbi:MAG: alpha/beta fold hydrolase [Verrucomicrobiae bacterium]|nr:alpha/beta fold hydrolase [Verrucomicrobiae bacterium]
MIHALHGNLGSGSDWTALGIEDLRAVDLWSWQEQHPGITLTKFGEAFAAEVEAIDPQPILLGYSLGGRLALQAMTARPFLWKAAILVSTHPGLASENEREERLETDHRWASRARVEDWAEFLESWNRQPVLASSMPSAAQVSLESRREAVASAFESWSLGHQVAVKQAFPFPVLMINGELDEKFSALANRFPGAEMVRVSNAGHRLPTEQPGELALVIRDWLAKIG